MASRQQQRKAVETYASVLRGQTVAKREPLECPYAFWFSKRKNYVDFPAELRRISRIWTVEDFWKAYSHISKPSEMKESNLFLFQDGIVPLWEKNRSGGHWQLVLSKGLVSRCWEDLLLSMIGNRLSVDSSEIAGIAVTVRDEKDWITVWNQNGSNEETVETIRRDLVKILNLPTHTTLTYRRNSEYATWESILSQTKVLKRLGHRGVDYHRF